MSKEIVIQASKKETRIAIVEDGALVELYIENPENARTIGDIHLGRVRNVMPSIQAAFVNIGQKQDAFLHFSDVGETLVDLLKMIGEEPEVSNIDVHVPRVHRSIKASGDYDSSPRNQKQKQKKKKGKDKGKGSNGSAGKNGFIHPARYLRNGERILVQIVKEPISSKGSRITSHVTLAGRFLVLVPFGDYVAVSKKIWSARERKRLQALGRSLLPEGFGLIIRTVAAGKDAKTLHTDMSLLVQKWERIQEKLSQRPSPPKLLHQDVSMVSSVIRDLFTDDYERILIDDHRLFRSVQTYIRAVAPDMLPAIEHHNDKQPVFEAVSIDGAIAQAFSSRVELPSGGYLIIEHTEAMHVIDVNSGRAGKGESQEENSLKVDLEAASTIAHQLRLRDLGGIIVVDFIDLREERNRSKVVNRLKQEFRKDRAVTKVLPMSDFGLIQITRQRLRPSITTDETTREAEQASIDVVREISSTKASQARRPTIELLLKRLDDDLTKMRRRGDHGPVNLRVHPFFAAFLRKGIPSKLNRLRLKHRLKVNVHEDERQSAITYDLVSEHPTVRTVRKDGAPQPEQPKDAVPRPDQPKEERIPAGSKGKTDDTDARGDGGGRSSSRPGQKRSGRGSGRSQTGRSKSGQRQSGRGRANQTRSGQKQSGRGGSSRRQSTRTEASSKQSEQNEPRQNQPRQNQPRQNEPRQNQPRQNQPRQNQPRQNQPRQNQSRQNEPRQNRSAEDQSGRNQATENQSGGNGSGSHQNEGGNPGQKQHDGGGRNASNRSGRRRGRGNRNQGQRQNEPKAEETQS